MQAKPVILPFLLHFLLFPTVVLLAASLAWQQARFLWRGILRRGRWEDGFHYVEVPITWCPLWLLRIVAILLVPAAVVAAVVVVWLVAVPVLEQDKLW
jgi:hypothetical protein